MKNLILPGIISVFSLIICSSCNIGAKKDNAITWQPVNLNANEKEILAGSLKSLHERYDPSEKMISKKISGYNYHTDATTGVFHEVRGSFSYAVLLLDLGDKQFFQRAFEVIGKTISLQNQDTTSKSCGVWPYYMEEPLATKKAPIDYNWADFNAVSLLDVWMGHQAEIPQQLKGEIKDALILAAKAIRKRNVGAAYTNIAIMGTYVTYMVAHLFDLPDMKVYATKRLQNFYDYTLEKGGFSEYNSPTYTIVALDELFRMKSHIIEPSAKMQIDSLYSIGWETIARHYHQPSGQWAGPHSRSYSTLIKPSFYAILKEGSNGKIDVGIEEKRSDVKIKHQMPGYLLHYFLSPEYPRTETNVFEKNEPQTIGTCFMNKDYAVSSVSRSSLWNQRRPFLVYWGNVQSPKYLQVRFLHDDYDFSSASFYGQQIKNKLLAGINFIKNGGDKHISIDRLKEGKFKAKDLRLRFEFGNLTNLDDLKIPVSADQPFKLSFGQLTFDLHLFTAKFGDLKGHWEKGGDNKIAWIDFVFFSGSEREIDLNEINQAVIGFTFAIDNSGKNAAIIKPTISGTEGMMKVNWNGLTLELPMKPQAPKNSFL
jgi:hypothetical protein